MLNSFEILLSRSHVNTASSIDIVLKGLMISSSVILCALWWHLMDRSIKASKHACFEITEAKIYEKKKRLKQALTVSGQGPGVAVRNVNMFTDGSSESDTLYQAIEFMHPSIINTPELNRVLTTGL
jgi:hypothetical protein